jgi:hypothetical protein
MAESIARRLVFETVPPVWGVAVLAGLCVVTVWLSWRAGRPLGSWRVRAVLTALRAVAALGLALAILGPGLERRRSVRVRNRVAVVVDRSASMGLPADASGVGRMALARRLFEERSRELGGLGEAFELDWYAFGEGLEPIGGAEAATAPDPGGRKTDIGGALAAAGGAARGGVLRGVLLVSDGADNAGLGGLKGEERQAALEALAERVGVPVHTYLCGSEAAVRDAAIVGVHGSRVAFTRRPWPLTVEVELSGYRAGTSVPVTLRVGGRLIATRTVTAGGEGGLHRAGFEWTPTRVGREIVSVTIPPRADELLKGNNARTFVLSAVRDKIRVLHVAGEPSWDVRFLRRTLKRDPSVDLVSFFILRTMRDPVPPNTNEYRINLIPLPAHELFTGALKSFDVVVFQNFDYRPYDMPGYLSFGLYLARIREQVEKGGAGFVMVGGDQSFDRGGYAGTPIEALLPVRLGAGEVDETEFKAALTEAGRRHPVTAVGGGSEETERLWRGMPAMPGCHVLEAAPGAVVLMRGAKGAPVVAAGEAGAGRALAVTTDGTWRWSFEAAGQGRGNVVYLRFWRNALRWLARDPVGRLVRVETDKTEYGPGEVVTLQVEVLGGDYRPAAGVERTVRVERVGTGEEAVRRTGRTDAQGRLLLSFPDLSEGAYRVEVSGGEAGEAAEEGEGEAAQAETCFNVADRSEELRRVELGAGLMEEVAAATGGRMARITAEAVPGLPEDIPNPEVLQAVARRFEPIWPRWWWLGVVVLALAGEWWLRRSSGLS